MRYYEIVDDLSPQGQLYRMNEDVLEVQSELTGEWVESAWTMVYGPIGAIYFFNLNGSDGTVITEVEAPV